MKDIGLYQFYVTCTKHIAFWFASASPREPPANKITARVRDSKEDINFCSRLFIFRNSAWTVAKQKHVCLKTDETQEVCEKFCYA